MSPSSVGRFSRFSAVVLFEREDGTRSYQLYVMSTHAYTVESAAEWAAGQYDGERAWPLEVRVFSLPLEIFDVDPPRPQPRWKLTRRSGQ